MMTERQKQTGRRERANLKINPAQLKIMHASRRGEVMESKSSHKRFYIREGPKTTPTFTATYFHAMPGTLLSAVAGCFSVACLRSMS